MLARSLRRMQWAWCVAFAFILCFTTADAPTAWAQSLIVHVCVRPPGIGPGIERWAYTPNGVPVITTDPMQFTAQTAGLPIFVYDPNAAELALRHLPYFARKDLKCPMKVLPSTSVLPMKDGVAGGDVLDTSEPTLPTSKSTLPASVLPQKLRTCKVSPAASAPTSHAATTRDDNDDTKLPMVTDSSSGKVPMTAPCGDCKPTGAGQTKAGGNKVTESLALMNAILTGQMDDINRPDGKPYGIPGGLNPNGPNSATLQGVAAGASIVLTFVDVRTLFRKALNAAIKKGEPLLIKEVPGLTKDAAEFIAEKEGYAAADALAKNKSIGPYAVMKKFTDGLGHRWEAHHLFEQAQMGRFNYSPADIANAPSVIMTEAEHKAMHNALKTETPLNASKEQLWEVYKLVYEDNPNWLEAIKSYFGK